MVEMQVRPAASAKVSAKAERLADAVEYLGRGMFAVEARRTGTWSRRPTASATRSSGPVTATGASSAAPAHARHDVQPRAGGGDLAIARDGASMRRRTGTGSWAPRPRAHW